MSGPARRLLLLLALLVGVRPFADVAQGGGDEPAPGPDTGAPAAKRVGPAPVAAVQAAGLRFEVIHWGRERGLAQNGGYIAAFDPESRKELWLLQVYAIRYQPDLEEDVQDVFIESMRWNAADRTLEIRDELGRQFTVDPATRTVKELHHEDTKTQSPAPPP